MKILVGNGKCIGIIICTILMMFVTTESTFAQEMAKAFQTSTVETDLAKTAVQKALTRQFKDYRVLSFPGAALNKFLREEKKGNS